MCLRMVFGKCSDDKEEGRKVILKMLVCLIAYDNCRDCYVDIKKRRMPNKANQTFYPCKLQNRRIVAFRVELDMKLIDVLSYFKDDTINPKGKN